MSVKKIVINTDQTGRRLDNFLMSILFDLPKSKIYSMIRKGEIRINSGRVKPNTKLNKDDKLRLPPYIQIPTKEKVFISDNKKKLIKNSVIYEDSNYIIINKPIGLAVHGGTDNKYGVISIIRSLYDDSVDLCHRIDKETSGCLVFSKNKKSSKHFYMQLSERNVYKSYKAILKGKLTNNIEVTKNIGENKLDASSSFKIINSSDKATYVDIDISTGRTHQIRIHSNEIGHPVINDDKYGDWKFNKSIQTFGSRMGLHAYKLNFTDQNGKHIKVISKLDKSFQNLLELLN